MIYAYLASIQAQIRRYLVIKRLARWRAAAKTVQGHFRSRRALSNTRSKVAAVVKLQTVLCRLRLGRRQARRHREAALKIQASTAKIYSYTHIC